MYWVAHVSKCLRLHMYRRAAQAPAGVVSCAYHSTHGRTWACVAWRKYCSCLLNGMLVVLKSTMLLSSGCLWLCLMRMQGLEREYDRLLSENDGLKRQLARMDTRFSGSGDKKSD